MRRLLDHCGGAARCDALAAADADVNSDEEDLPYEAWVGYRKAKRELTKKGRSWGMGGESGKVKAGVETLNGINP